MPDDTARDSAYPGDVEPPHVSPKHRTLFGARVRG
jgi:hypothetical protein